MARIRCLSGNMLKLFAALAMTVDHIGVILFPRITILRVIGRFAFPIFAFMIAQGCHYTRNKVRYFLTVFGVGAVCQLTLFCYNGSLEMNILITFSLSVLLIYALQFFKEALFSSHSNFLQLYGSLLLLLGGVLGVFVLGTYVDLDYGATGVMVPLFAALLHPAKKAEGTPLHRLQDPIPEVLVMALGLLILAIDDGGTQYYSLLCVPLLCLYSGKRGKYKLKYFFYIFYPAHLLLLQGIAWFLM